jgi:hypothetical protein
MRHTIFAILAIGLTAIPAGARETEFQSGIISKTASATPTVCASAAAGDICAADDVIVGDDLVLENSGVVRNDTNGEIEFAEGTEDLSFGFGTSNMIILTSDSGVIMVEPAAIDIFKSMSYTIDTLVGAGIGMAGIQTDATALSNTAAEENFLYFANGAMLNEVSVTDAGGGGACTPTMDAEGLDICVGVADNDAVELWGGMYGASGRAFVAGTDAITFCTTWNIHDVSGSDAMYCGVRTMSDAAQEPITGYTDYCGTGHVQGQYKVTDKTTGDTDCGADAIADDETDTWCVIVSAAGACTYTVDGVAPSTTDAHTLTSGKLFIPFCNMRSHSDVADDTWLTDWTFSKTN